jgi:acyl-CoA synthetase (AMP-forming)/AMP-acid ligase II
MGPTGGSTGLPKLVPRSHNMLICSSEYAAKAWDFNQTDICLLAGPLGHDLTFTKGLDKRPVCLCKSIFQGSTKMAGCLRGHGARKGDQPGLGAHPGQASGQL